MVDNKQLKIFNEQMNRAGAEMAHMAEVLAPVLTEFAQKMNDLGMKINDLLWYAYEEAGYPYGSNQKGRDLWLRERAEIQQLREKANELEFWHESLSEIRRIVRDKEE